MKLPTIVTLSLLPLLSTGAPCQTADLASTWNSVARQTAQQLIAVHYAEAATTGKRAVQLARKFGAADSRLGNSYYLLGVVFRDWGHCAESRANYLSAIAVWHRQPKLDEPHLFHTVAGLVSVLAECDDFPAAAKAFHTYEADLRRVGPDPGDQAQLISLEATLARGRKDYAKSESLFRQAIELLDRTPGSSRIEVMGFHNSRSVALTRMGRNKEALSEALLAADFFERVAPRHASYIAALNNAACILADLNRRDESQRVFEKALAAATDLYGEDNRILAQIMLSYARVLRENHETPAATEWRKRGAEAYRRSILRDSQTVDIHELQMK
jgi:tetratricopeptide (TPR) repeat protein